MKNNYNFCLGKLLQPFLVFLFALTYAGISFAQVPADNCVDLPGGVVELSFSTTEQRAFPSDYSFDTENVTEITRATAGTILAQPGLISTPGIITIDPTLRENKTGVVVLQFLPDFELFEGEILTIYKENSEGLELIQTITPDNSVSKQNTSIVVDGAARIEFMGGTIPYPFMRYYTGDHAFEVAVTGRHSAIWQEIIEPDSYAVVDDVFYDNDHDSWLPVVTAYFDENKEYVRAQRTFCIDIYAKIPSLTYDTSLPAFPGMVQYSRDAEENYDLDRSGDHDENDKLIAAQILWLLDQANNPGLTNDDLIGIQVAIWAVQGDAPYGYNQWYYDAIAAVPGLPSPPEPDPFTLDATDASVAIKSNPIPVRIQFTVEDDSEEVVEGDLKLVIPAGLNVEVTNGGNYDPMTRTLTPDGPIIDLEITSDEVGTFTIQALFDSPKYYNVKNLNIYVPCTTVYQRFLHVGEDNLMRPFRSIELEWVNDPLPVNLVSFNAEKSEGAVSLTWSTTNEQDFSHFEVERSRDTRTWEKLGKIAANNSHRYSYLDGAPLLENRYYRLKMVDLDGSFEYSPIRSVSADSRDGAVALYPNPATSYVTVNSELVENVSIYNLAGIRVAGRPTYAGSKVDLTGLNEGIYLAVLKLRNGQQISQKIIVQR